jgi:hypothetical protein
MLRYAQPTFVILAGCVFWLFCNASAPAQGVGLPGGKGPVNPGAGGVHPHRPLPPFGAGGQSGKTGTVGGGKTGGTGSGKTLPGRTGGGKIGGVNPGGGNSNVGNAGAGKTTGASSGAGFVNPLSGNQPGLINRIFGAPQPTAGPMIQSGVLVGPYGNVNLVGRWWEPVNSFTLLNSSGLQNLINTQTLLGLNNPFFNPLLSGGFNSSNLWGNSAFGFNLGWPNAANPFFGQGFNGTLSNPFLGNPWGNNWNSLFSNAWNSPFNNTPFGNPWTNPFNNPFGNPLNNPFNNPLGNPWNNPFNNPFSNPLNNPFNNGFNNAFGNPMLPAGAGLNNPFGGFRLF